MITELTKFQQEKLPLYSKKWVEKGLTTQQKTLEEAIYDFTNFQTHVLKRKNPAPVVLLNSPTQCWMAVLLTNFLFNNSKNNTINNIGYQVASQIKSQVEPQVRAQIWSQVWSQVASQIWSQIGNQAGNQVESQVGVQARDQVQSQLPSKIVSQVASQVGSQVLSQVRAQVGDQMWSQVTSQMESVRSQLSSKIAFQAKDQVWSQVWSQVESQIKSQVESQVESQVGSQTWIQVNSQVASQVGNQVQSQVESQVEYPVMSQAIVYPYYDCQFWAGWFSFYEFFKHEIGIIYPKEYDYFLNCQPYGMVWPLEELCIVCQPPIIIKKNGSGLHCENGPALRYDGDNEVFSLNGVRMEKEQVMTPAEKIDPLDILKETNVEVRRELLKKVGIERMMSVLPNKLLDKRGNYELYSIDLSEEVKDARYLKMINPSIGCFHMEGVGPSIKTISEALKWRNNNLFENAEILT